MERRFHGVIFVGVSEKTASTSCSLSLEKRTEAALGYDVPSAFVDGLSSEPADSATVWREKSDELVAEFGPAEAETIRAVLEDACSIGGAEWPDVVADWMANMGARSPLVIVHLALKIRAGMTIPALPSPCLQAAVNLAGLLSRADRDRAERKLAELPPAERRRRLNEGHRRNLAAISGTAPLATRAAVVERLKRARTQVARRVERHAQRLPARGARPRARAAPRRTISARRRARSPDRERSAAGGDADGPHLTETPRRRR